jgi:hypothetical protein
MVRHCDRYILSYSNLDEAIDRLNQLADA